MLKLPTLCVNENRGSMATILALYDILGVRVTIDTEREKAIIVRLESGKMYRFKQCDEIIYCFDTA